jgi:hypothetical protein
MLAERLAHHPSTFLKLLLRLYEDFGRNPSARAASCVEHAEATLLERPLVPRSHRGDGA